MAAQAGEELDKLKCESLSLFYFYQSSVLGISLGKAALLTKFDRQ